MHRIRAAALLAIGLAGCRHHEPSALLTSTELGDNRAMDAALASGANVNEKNPAGLTPLIIAARNGRAPAVALLLRHHADPQLRGGVNDWTPLMHAVHKNQPDTVQALLEGGAQVDARGRSGETALMMAAGYGYTAIVELLLDHGADPRAQTPDGANVLSMAVSGVPDLGHFTVGSCQSAAIQALKRRDPALSLPRNFWGGAAKLSATVAKLRGCAY